MENEFEFLTDRRGLTLGGYFGEEFVRNIIRSPSKLFSVTRFGCRY